MARTHLVVDLTSGTQTVVPYTNQEEADADAAKAAGDASKTQQALAQADIATMNALLSAPGSVVRGLALIVLDLANGVIPLKPATPYTTTQLINLIQQKMR